MFSLATPRKFLNKTNLYFVGSFVVLVVSIIVLLLLLKQQNIDNYQARLLLNNAKTYKTEIQKQQVFLQEIAPVNIGNLGYYDQKLKLTDLTRYFDNIAKTLSADGSTFDFTAISYSAYSSNGFIPAQVNITSNDSNLVKFLKMIEKSGITDKEHTYLMDLQSINVSVNTNTEEDAESVYSIAMNLRIYSFYE